MKTETFVVAVDADTDFIQFYTGCRVGTTPMHKEAKQFKTKELARRQFKKFAKESIPRLQVLPYSRFE